MTTPKQSDFPHINQLMRWREYEPGTNRLMEKFHINRMCASLLSILRGTPLWKQDDEIAICNLNYSEQNLWLHPIIPTLEKELQGHEEFSINPHDNDEKSLLEQAFSTVVFFTTLPITLPFQAIIKIKNIFSKR